MKLKFHNEYRLCSKRIENIIYNLRWNNIHAEKYITFYIRYMNVYRT